MNNETDYELFRKESVRNGFSFDGITVDKGEWYITKENCPPVKWLLGLRVAWAWSKVPTDKLSMKKRVVLEGEKKVEKNIGDIFLNGNLLYTIDLN
jgi:hypothetical protein